MNDELLRWLCAAPDHTLTLGGTSLTETQTAAQVLSSSTNWANPKQSGTCPVTDQFPLVTSPPTLWGTDATPQSEFASLHSEFLSPSPQRQADFATMNWYEALYYGLDEAQLQNAAGSFVSPSVQSVDAAIGDATANADGTLSFDFTNIGDPAAYPMPVVIYAAVPTDPTTPAQQAATRTVLEALLGQTGGSGANLPPGILPLTAGLATQASTAVDKYFPASSTAGGSAPKRARRRWRVRKGTARRRVAGGPVRDDHRPVFAGWCHRRCQLGDHFGLRPIGSGSPSRLGRPRSVQLQVRVRGPGRAGWSVVARHDPLAGVAALTLGPIAWAVLGFRRRASADGGIGTDEPTEPES